MMPTLDPAIRDQAYQFFMQESHDFLQELEEGLLTLRHGHEATKVHNLMRIAHSIKGGAATIGLNEIQAIAHLLETVLRVLYHREITVDLHLEDLLLQIYDALKVPLLQEIQTGEHDGASARQQAQEVFGQLQINLGDALNLDTRLPTTVELGIDVVHIIFTSDVTSGLARLERVLSNPTAEQVAGEIRAQAEVFIGVGGLANLPGFIEIAQVTKAAITAHPDRAIEIGQLAIADFQAAQIAVLDGDRGQGGSPSAALRELADGWFPEVQPASSDDALITDTADSASASLDAVRELSDHTALDAEVAAMTLPLDVSLEVEQILAATDELLADDAMAELENVLIQDWEEVLTDSSFEELEAYLSAPISQELLDEKVIPIRNLAVAQTVSSDLLTKNRTLLNLTTTDADDHPSNAAPPSISQKLMQRLNAPPKLSEPLETEPASLNEKLIQRLSTPASTPYSSGSVRVDLSRLQRINNLVGELFTQENSTVLQNQQLQGIASSVIKRFGHFEQIMRELAEWSDQSQNARVKLQAAHPSSAPVMLGSGDLNADFDPLQMDAYDRFHLMMQEVIEQIAHLGEAMQDIGLITQQAQQTQRQHQQTLKQVRNDLLRARMLPVADILQRFPRMVRDLCAKYNKQVNVRLNGAATLVDKAVLDKLFDPLVHLVRNAFDHGIEMPDLRVANGKPAEATIEIRAYHRGNQTYIVIRDDGRGIDAKAIRKKAIALGLVAPNEARKLSHEQLYEFLFSPGFSTAAQVTELSGRGVGLDAVRSQVRSLKGSITLTSQPDKGTTFVLRFPLTLSIAKLVVFSSQSHCMAIPSDTLAAIVMVASKELVTASGQQFYAHDGQLIPVYPQAALSKHYPLSRTSYEQAQALTLSDTESLPLLLVTGEFDGELETMALPVDYILQEQECLIKPFGSVITPPPYLYGCTVLGDGSLIPVIDGQALIAHKKSLDFLTRVQDGEPVAAAIEVAPPPPVEVTPVAQIPTLLVIDDSLTARQFLALTLEKAGYQVVQARDGKEALQQLQQTPDFQAIFCDIEMPRMNGFEFLTACRQELTQAVPPIIMLTSRSGEKHRQMAYRLGATGYLTKPYLEQELLKTLQDCLNQCLIESSPIA
jgi:two-component system, chemotaxis family, sensor histidine kinase and response regulator PixL